MANVVIQLVPVDPSLQGNTNFTSYTQYVINGTNYIIDNSALVVYEWAQNIVGPTSTIVNTGGSYTQFQSFLAANPPTTVTNTANYPVAVTTTTEQTVLLRGILLALITMACSGSQAVPGDFYPQNIALA